MNASPKRAGLTRNFYQLVYKFFLLSLCLNLASSQILFARTVTITEARNVREVDTPDEPLSLVGRLAAGTQIEIPDDYCVFRTDGTFDFDASVKKWAQAMKDKQGQAPVFAKFNATQKDYFIPVTVSKAASGSRVKDDNGKYVTDIPKGKTFYISIRNVAVASDSSMTTNATSKIYAQKDKSKDAHLEACADCSKPKTDDSGLAALQSQIQENLATVKRVSDESSTRPQTKREIRVPTTTNSTDYRIEKKFLEVDANLKQTCGFGLDKMVPEIERQVANTPFTASELLSIMAHESTGKCFPKAAAIKDPMEHGLFGITNSDSKIEQNEKMCNSETRRGVQEAAKSSDAFAALSSYATNPAVHCVGNPLLNLQASIRNLTEKLEYIQKRFPNRKLIINGKLTELGFKAVSEAYAGIGMRIYGSTALGDAVRLQDILSTVVADSK